MYAVLPWEIREEGIGKVQHGQDESSYDISTCPFIQALPNATQAKSCSLDPMPTSLVKEHASTLVPVIAKLVSLSLALGELPPPPDLKQAARTPLLKSYHWRKPS